MSTPPETEHKPETPALEDTPMADSEEVAPPQAEQAEDKEPEPVDVEKLKEQFQEKVKTYLIEQSRHVVIPSFAKWFDMNEIHLIEKKLFPDFFPQPTAEDVAPSVYKTPDTYRNMRDFMINTYRINPIEYLTVTAVRRNLAGDVASIIRIHRFLEKWGLINYQIDPRTKPSLVGPQYTGHFQLTLDTPKGLTPFVPENVTVVKGEKPAEKPAEKADVPAVKQEEKEDFSSIPINLEVSKNIFDEAGTSKAPAAVLYFCNETSNDVSDVRYHNLKSKALAGGNLGPLIISKECYDQGLFPLNFVASDFVKLDKSVKQPEWTQQEVLLLLEGIDMYASNDGTSQSLFINTNGQWDRIAEHVATKTREECLIKFLQLPIEDKYLHKLVKLESTKSLEKDLSKEAIIEEVVKKLIQSNEGKSLVAQNAKNSLEESVLNQTNLINQVIELTLEKFEAKMKLINHLEADLVKTENLLNLQRKQLLVERWSNFEKLSKFKQQNNNPELVPLLDDLLTPININEINKNFNKINLDATTESATPGVSDELKEDALPLSVVEPKAYQFWSA